MAYGLLLLRVVAGGTIFAHGAQKLFGWFGGHGVRGTAGFFENLGYRPAVLLAGLAGRRAAGGGRFAFGFPSPRGAVGGAVGMFNTNARADPSKGVFHGDRGGARSPPGPA